VTVLIGYGVKKLLWKRISIIDLNRYGIRLPGWHADRHRLAIIAEILQRVGLYGRLIRMAGST
jgi:hypothetical protein